MNIKYRMQDNQFDAFGYPKDGKLRCAFCFPGEQFTHGEVKREWSSEWHQMIPLCRTHAILAQEPDADMGRMEHDECGDKF